MSTYVCSDIHGCLNKFNQLLKKIAFSSSDTMFVLGDVIDRGPDGIKLLQKIMGMPNVQLLLGNHELMMFNAYLYDDLHHFDLWYQNGGLHTDKEFELLSQDEKDEILDYIITLPVVLEDVQVGDKQFYLVHSNICKKDVAPTDNLTSLTRGELDQAVWQRYNPRRNITTLSNFEKHKGKIMIAGHTCSNHYTIEGDSVPMHIVRLHKSHYINIDCGCSYYAHGRPYGRLGCLRLEDFKEFYV